MTRINIIQRYKTVRVRDDAFIERVNLRLKGFRLCHNKSARKHRRRGDEVRYVNEGWYAWRRRVR